MGQQKFFIVFMTVFGGVNVISMTLHPPDTAWGPMRDKMMKNRDTMLIYLYGKSDHDFDNQMTAPYSNPAYWKSARVYPNTNDKPRPSEYFKKQPKYYWDEKKNRGNNGMMGERWLS